jgi:thiamine biosynthesis lipoprotein
MAFNLAASVSRPRVMPAVAVRGAARGQWLVRNEAIMGTEIHVELWSDDAVAGRAAAEAVIQEMHRIDRAMSPYKHDSELSHINRNAFAAPVPVSHEMFTLLQRAVRFSALTDGAFDITYAAVGQLYDYRRGVLPTPHEIELARQAVGYEYLELDVATRSVRFAREGMRIDLGGFAKGHAVDNSVALLRELGIAHAIVSAGGDSRVIGDRRGRPWTVAVRDPRRADAIVAVVPLEDTSISTSGDYERFFERDGVRHHHLIDPKTGSSPRSVRSVTILAADGLTCEALSKCVFVSGLKGMRWVESLPGVDAIVIDADGALHVTSGLVDSRSQPGGDTPQ